MQLLTYYVPRKQRQVSKAHASYLVPGSMPCCDSMSGAHMSLTGVQTSTEYANLCSATITQYAELHPQSNRMMAFCTDGNMQLYWNTSSVPSTTKNTRTAWTQTLSLSHSRTSTTTKCYRSHDILHTVGPVSAITSPGICPVSMSAVHILQHKHHYGVSETRSHAASGVDTWTLDVWSLSCMKGIA